MEKIRKYVTVGKTVAARKPANAGTTKSWTPPSVSKSTSAPPPKTVNNREETNRPETGLLCYKSKSRLRDVLRGSASSVRFILKDLVSFFRLLDAKGDLIGDANAVTFEGDYFLWMIR